MKYWLRYLFSNLKGLDNKLETILCRLKGHPNGVVWYASADSLEPNMSCKDCGEDLG